jgi:rhamnosyltransferase
VQKIILDQAALAFDPTGKQTMTVQSVCAVVVTYHPSVENIAHLSDILVQVQGLVVVDNGSNEEELAPLRAASRTLEFHLIENRENLGIAEALNQGVIWVQSKGHPWVILFDQDSTITRNFVTQLFEAWEAHPGRQRVASIQPKYIMPETGVESPVVPRASDGGPVTAMTSGTLLPIWIFDKIGYFASEYFIDMVDCEYSLRIRANGYLLADSRQAVLLHSAGNPLTLTFLGFSFGPSNHSAMRRYYISRNRIVVYRKYFRQFPRWTLHSMHLALRETIKCFVAEQDRPRKFRNFLLGTWDGLTGRMGKREGL